MAFPFRAGITLAALVSSTAVMAAPSVGNLAFTAVNADEDGFALTSFVDLMAGEQFYFTDREWNGALPGAGGDFLTGEGVLTWTLDANVAAGEVIRFASVNSATSLWSSVGDLGRSGSFSLAAPTDSVTLYLDQAGVITPLAAIGWGGFVASPGAGLDGAVVNLDGRVDFAEYVGPRSGETTLEAYRTSLLDTSQWIVRKETIETNTAPYLGGFTVTAPVPEPETYAMMLAGLGMIGTMVKRRRKC